MAQPITKLQLRCLQTLWSVKMRAAGISSADDSRDMRHQYIEVATAGRAKSATELSFPDARRVIDMLSREQQGLQIDNAEVAQAAGTHGRRGFQSAHEVMVGEPQVRLLRQVQLRLGWDYARLDAFIERQLGQGREIRTMADFNRVYWGLKRIAKAIPTR